jgi:hypothetical protein
VPLQNRVNPFGELCAFSARGLFMGNRGGRFHTDAMMLTTRRWASRQWICCVLDFKGRRREVWGRSYTELFFLDEPTAFAAGHRPCFECRRKDAQLFAEKWDEAHRNRKQPYAAEMDNVLHAERLQGRVKRLHRCNIDELPDGTFAALDGAAFNDATLQCLPRSGQVADDDQPCGDAHTGLERSVRLESSHRRDQFQPRPYRPLGVVLVSMRVSEVDQDAVSEVFGHEAV